MYLVVTGRTCASGKYDVKDNVIEAYVLGTTVDETVRQNEEVFDPGGISMDFGETLSNEAYANGILITRQRVYEGRAEMATETRQGNPTDRIV